MKEIMPEQYKEKLHAKIQRAREIKQKQINKLYERVLVAYWRTQDGYIDDLEALINKTDNKKQEKIVNLIKQNKLDMSSIFKAENNYSEKFSFLNDYDDVQDQLIHLAGIDKQEVGERALLFQQEVFRHIDKCE